MFKKFLTPSALVKIVVLLGLLGGLFFLLRQSLPAMGDDAYIHVRTASNFATYGLPYYNPAENVKADSSTVFLIILGMTFKLFSEHLSLIALMNSFFILSSGYLFTLSIRTALKSRAAGAAAVLVGLVFLVGYIPLMLNFHTEYMETPLAMFLMASFLILYLNGKKTAFVFLGVAVFTRTELWVFAGAFILLAWITAKFQRSSALKFFLIGALPFLVFELVFFGTIVPNAMIAKRAVYAFSFDQTLSSMFGGLYPSSWSLDLKKLLVSVSILSLAAFGLYPGAIWSGLKHVRQTLRNLPDHDIEIWVFWACGIAIALSYLFVFGTVAPWYFQLYSVPLVLATCIFAGKSKKSLLLILILVPVLISPVQGFFIRSYAAFFESPPYPFDNLSGRVRKYIEVGRKLYQAYPQATLLTSEIGGLGYGFKGKILDGVGLVSPEAIKYHPMKVPDERPSGMTGAIPPGLIQDKNPEIIVSYSSFIGAFQKSDLVNNYILIEEAPLLPEDMRRSVTQTVWGTNSLSIYIRKDIYKSP